MEITADATAAKLLEMDAARNPPLSNGTVPKKGLMVKYDSFTNDLLHCKIRYLADMSK